MFWRCTAILSLLTSSAAAAPKVSCVMTNHPVTTVEHQKDGSAKLYEVDDWRVHCKLTSDDKTIFDDDLELAHPARFREAADAVEEFRTKTAAKLLKEKKK